MSFSGLAKKLLTAALLFNAALATAQPDETVHISYLYSDGNMQGTLASFRELLQERPDLQGRIELSFLTESLFDEVQPESLLDSDVLVLDMMNQAIMDRFDQAHDVDLIREVSARGQVLVVGAGVQPSEYFTEQGAQFSEEATTYFLNGGDSNRLGLMKYALEMAGIEGLERAAPEAGLDFGYYLFTPAAGALSEPAAGALSQDAAGAASDADGGQVYADWAEFEQALQSRPGFDPNAPKIAVGFYRDNYYGGETQVIDAVIAEIERRGATPIPLFGYPGHVAYERLLLDNEGESRADVVLSFLMRFASLEASGALSKLDIPVINLVTLYGRSEQEWRESETGLSMFESTYQIVGPELGGLIAPTVVGSRERQFDPLTNLTITVDTPIAERVEMAVSRALAFTDLSATAAAERRLAVMYYNYPVGEANIGASYLNVPESLESILRSLREAGYDVGEAELSTSAILANITTRARNIGDYAPAELEQLVESGGAALIPVSEYETWLGELNPMMRDKMLADWGEPAETDLMAMSLGGERVLVVPKVEYGNITLMPQPVRGWSVDLEALYHADDLAPHHQYAAAYLWLRKQQQVDAIIHLGTHGTLEWLDGKDVGLGPEDAPDALLGELANVNIYNVDVVGEGLIARRRGMATLVDHMVPPFVAAGSYSDLALLSESINDYHRNVHKNEELSRVLAQQIVQQLADTGLAKTLSLDLTLDENGQFGHEALHSAQDQLAVMRGENIPFGLHSFGRLPSDEAVDSTVEAVFGADRSQLPDSEFYYSQTIRDSITQSADLETSGMLSALGGGYVGTGSGGDPIRNPDAYPTGKNFYGIDPDKVPKKAAWTLGVKLADELLANHLAENGRYPEKVSFVIWGDETMRHEGVIESQVFHLLGTKPVWDERDKVVGVEVIPSRQLGRPRIDIVIASAAEGMFNNVTMLMDEAVQRVKALEETENFVREHYLQTKATLIEAGYSEEDADRRASVRIFDEPPGRYNLNTSNIAAESGSWDSTVGMGNDYINKMGHGYGNGFWGEPMQDVFKLALADVETVVHSSSSALYGGLDNDDFFMYMGGLANAVELVSGSNPELLVTNTRNPGMPEMSSIDKFIGSEFATRYVNPNWIEGMQEEGYAGARAMSEFVEYMWGWDATVTDVVDNSMWQQTFEVYVQDKHDMNMDEFFDENSPFAFQDIAARMIETVRKGYWEADEATLTELLESYVESFEQHGISCSDVSCGNPRLMEYILNEGAAAGIDGVSLAELRAAIEAVTRMDVEQAARELEQFAELNDAQIAELYSEGAAAANPQGYRMEPIEQPSSSLLSSQPAELPWLSVVIQAFVLLSLIVWWYRRRVTAVRLS